MSVYLGSLGRMVELKCPSSQQLAMEGEPSFEYSLEGRRLAQVAPSIGRRAWQCQLSDASTPDQVGAVMAFINREWGNGPFNFVSADAPVTNLMSPAASSCDPTLVRNPLHSSAGPVLLPEGNWAGASIALSDTSQPLIFGLDYIPVLPGVPVTASAWVRGPSAGTRIHFYDAAGTSISDFTSVMRATETTYVRCWVTATPPINAVSCRVFGRLAQQGTRPAITWTGEVFDWADGQGCPKAIIHSPSRNLVMASRDPRGGRYSNLSFTASEVG